MLKLVNSLRVVFVCLTVAVFVGLILYRTKETPRLRNIQELPIEAEPLRMLSPKEALRSCSNSLVLCIKDVSKQDDDFAIHLSDVQRSLINASNLRLVDKSANTPTYRSLYVDLLQCQSSVLMFLESKHDERETTEFIKRSLVTMQNLNLKIEDLDQ